MCYADFRVNLAYLSNVLQEQLVCDNMKIGV